MKPEKPILPIRSDVNMHKQITMTQLHDRYESLAEDEVVLDVRGRDEFSAGHVPGSRNIPHEEVEKHVEELRKFSAVYIHCQAGRRAQIAFESLEKFGLKNLVCVAGSGMKDWLAAGYPVEK